MNQYVLQFKVSEGPGLWIGWLGWLAKSFQVSAKSPIPEKWASNRVQIVTENGVAFGEIVKIYEKYKETAPFNYNEETRTLSCSGAIEESWVL